MVARITQRECRRLIANGTARKATYEAVNGKFFDTVALGYGIYGMNCGLFRERGTGDLWACPDRSSELFYMR